MSKGAIVGITVGCVVLILGLLIVGIYAFKQKKKAERAMVLSKPFGMYPIYCIYYYLFLQVFIHWRKPLRLHPHKLAKEVISLDA